MQYVSNVAVDIHSKDLRTQGDVNFANLTILVAYLLISGDISRCNFQDSAATLYN